MNTFQVWRQGWVTSGEQSDTARLMGDARGETFSEALRSFAAEHPDENWRFDDHGNVVSYWGCGLFDNERDARERFG